MYTSHKCTEQKGIVGGDLIDSTVRVFTGKEPSLWVYVYVQYDPQ